MQQDKPACLLHRYRFRECCRSDTLPAHQRIEVGSKTPDICVSMNTSKGCGREALPLQSGPAAHNRISSYRLAAAA